MSRPLVGRSRCDAGRVSSTRPPAPQSRKAQIRYRYHRLIQYPLFLFGLMFLTGFITLLDPESSPESIRVGQWLVTVSWLVFAADFFIGLALSQSWRKYIRTHLTQAIAIIFPPLRILLLGRIFKMLAEGAKDKFGERVRAYALYVTTLILFFDSFLVVLVERNAPGSNIRTVGDALWWGTETVSTVGYGDFYPVTTAGRILAVVLFVNGIALLAIVTAILSARVLGQGQVPSATINDLDARLARIEERLTDLHTSVQPPVVLAAAGSGPAPAGEAGDGS